MNSFIQKLLIAFLCYLLSSLFFGYMAAIGVAIVVVVFLSFFNKLNNTLPIQHLILLIAGLQWILGPVLEYYFFNTDPRYKMYVSENEYFGFVVPAFLTFLAGFSFFQSSKLNQLLEELREYQVELPKFIPYVFIALGFLAASFGEAVPPALRFIFFLLSGLKYIGIIYLFLIRDSRRWFILGSVFILTISGSLALGVFHDLLLWGVLLFLYIAYFENVRSYQKILILVLGLFSAYLIQVVKSEYRQTLNTQYVQASNTDTFLDLASKNVSSDHESVSQSQNVVTRMNQGWIISRVLFYVPRFEPHADGETVTEALSASLLPRFLAPEKKKAGGQENFERFTGLYLNTTTSMGTSILGEAYANYGQYGGVLFMFLWGLMLSASLSAIVKFSDRYPTLILWLPIIFLQVIKAETELVVVLNHLVKASIMVAAFFWSFRKFGYRL